MKKRWCVLCLLLVFCLCLGACSTQKNDQDEEISVLGCTILYGKQYYAYRVMQFALISDYSEKVTVYDEGVELWELLQNAEKTELDEEMGQVWGYCINFYDHSSNKIPPELFITVDGRLHDGEHLYALEAPDAILSLLEDTVQPTNIDAVR